MYILAFSSGSAKTANNSPSATGRNAAASSKLSPSNTPTSSRSKASAGKTPKTPTSSKGPKVSSSSVTKSASTVGTKKQQVAARTSKTTPTSKAATPSKVTTKTEEATPTSRSGRRVTATAKAVASKLAEEKEKEELEKKKKERENAAAEAAEAKAAKMKAGNGEGSPAKKPRMTKKRKEQLAKEQERMKEEKKKILGDWSDEEEDDEEEAKKIKEVLEPFADSDGEPEGAYFMEDDHIHGNEYEGEEEIEKAEEEARRKKEEEERKIQEKKDEEERIKREEEEEAQRKKDEEKKKKEVAEEEKRRAEEEKQKAEEEKKAKEEAELKKKEEEDEKKKKEEANENESKKKGTESETNGKDKKQVEEDPYELDIAKVLEETKVPVLPSALGGFRQSGKKARKGVSFSDKLTKEITLKTMAVVQPESNLDHPMEVDDEFDEFLNAKELSPRTAASVAGAVTTSFSPHRIYPAKKILKKPTTSPVSSSKMGETAPEMNSQESAESSSPEKPASKTVPLSFNAPDKEKKNENEPPIEKIEAKKVEDASSPAKASSENGVKNGNGSAAILTEESSSISVAATLLTLGSDSNREVKPAEGTEVAASSATLTTSASPARDQVVIELGTKQKEEVPVTALSSPTASLQPAQPMQLESHAVVAPTQQESMPAAVAPASVQTTVPQLPTQPVMLSTAPTAAVQTLVHLPTQPVPVQQTNVSTMSAQQQQQQPQSMRQVIAPAVSAATVVQQQPVQSNPAITEISLPTEPLPIVPVSLPTEPIRPPSTQVAVTLPTEPVPQVTLPTQPVPPAEAAQYVEASQGPAQGNTGGGEEAVAAAAGAQYVIQSEGGGHHQIVTTTNGQQIVLQQSDAAVAQALLNKDGAGTNGGAAAAAQYVTGGADGQETYLILVDDGSGSVDSLNSQTLYIDQSQLANGDLSNMVLMTDDGVAVHTGQMTSASTLANATATRQSSAVYQQALMTAQMETTTVQATPPMVAHSGVDEAVAQQPAVASVPVPESVAPPCDQFVAHQDQAASAEAASHHQHASAGVFSSELPVPAAPPAVVQPSSVELVASAVTHAPQVAQSPGLVPVVVQPPATADASMAVPADQPQS